MSIKPTYLPSCTFFMKLFLLPHPFSILTSYTGTTFLVDETTVLPSFLGAISFVKFADIMVR